MLYLDNMQSDGNFLLTIEVLGEKTEYTAPSIVEAFNQVKPEIVRGKALLTVSKGDKIKSIPLHPFQLKRVMNNKNFRDILSKRLETFVK